MTKLTTTKTSRWIKTASVLALALALGTIVAAPAMADPGGDHHPGGPHYDNRGPHYGHDEWREHERSSRYWRVHHPVMTPGYVYAPPVIYSPPPPPMGLNLIVPLRIN